MTMREKSKRNRDGKQQLFAIRMTLTFYGHSLYKIENLVSKKFNQSLIMGDAINVTIKHCKQH